MSFSLLEARPGKKLLLKLMQLLLLQHLDERQHGKLIFYKYALPLFYFRKIAAKALHSESPLTIRK